MKKSVNKLNKKAQDLSIATLILIVLGIILLVLLILGFSYGWSNLLEKINIFGGKTSISDVVINCNFAVTSNAVYEYCYTFKKLTINGKTEYVNCQDDRVEQGIETKLDCTGDTEENRIKKQCISLIKNKKTKEDTKVNSQLCWNKYECEKDFEGTKIINVKTCPDGDKQTETYSNDGVGGLGDNDVCCIK